MTPPFSRANTAARFWTAEFMSFSSSANGTVNSSPGSATADRPRDHSLRQGKDWDLLLPNAVGSGGNISGDAYNNPLVTDMKAGRDPARTALRGSLYFVGYGNDGAVVVDDKAGDNTPDGTDAPYHDSWYGYDVEFSGSWNNATKLDHTVRVKTTTSSTGKPNFMMALWDSAYVNQHATYYANALGPSGLNYDGALVDVMGPVPPTTWGTLNAAHNKLFDPTLGPSGREPTTNEWIGYTASATSTLQSQIKALPNGIYDGTAYFETTGPDPRNTKRLATAGSGGMVEEFVRQQQSAAVITVSGNNVLKIVSTQDIIDSANMLADAEANDKSLLCITKIWAPYGDGASHDDYSTSFALNMSKQWFKYSFAIFLLGADGRSFFSFRDDAPDINTPHRELIYPLDTLALNNDTKSAGRRRQFSCQFYGADDKWMDRIDIGLPLTRLPGTVYTVVSGFFRRDYDNGYVFVNNTTSNKTFAIPSGTFYDIDGSFHDINNVTYTGGHTVTIPPRSGMILSKTRVTASGTYATTAPTVIGVSSVELHGTATGDATIDSAVAVVTKVSDSTDVRTINATQDSPPSGTAWSAMVTGLLPNTQYNFIFTWHNTSDAFGSSSPRSFTTAVDTDTPIFTGTISAVPSSRQILLSWPAATDAGGVKKYNITRTGGSSFTPVSVLSPITSYIDTHVVPSTNYTYSIVAEDYASHTSTPALTVSSTTTAETASEVGWVIGIRI